MNILSFKTLFFVATGLYIVSIHAADTVFFSAFERGGSLSCERTGMVRGQALSNQVDIFVPEETRFPTTIVVENVRMMKPLCEEEQKRLKQIGLPISYDYPALSFIEEKVIESAAEFAQLVEALRVSQEGTRFIIKQKTHQVLMTLDFRSGKISN